MMNFETARNQMLSQQIRTWDVLDRTVLQVLHDTPRELFVPESERQLAFADIEIPLPHGQSMLSPKLEARLLQELRVQPSDSALVIGTGSGYLAACVSRLARDVQSIDIFDDLNAAAAPRLKAVAADVKLETMDATLLSVEHKFDVVAITASVPTLSENFVRMLRPHGRMFVVVGRGPAMEAQLVMLTGDGQRTTDSLFETVLTPMINAEQAETFVL